MIYYSLFFEARGIQSYIFDSGKMKEMVGASEIVKELCQRNGKLDEVVRHLKMEEIIPSCKEDSMKISNMEQNQIFFIRRSGGSFSAIFADETKRDRFLAIWSLLVTRLAPGLETVHAISENENLKKLVEDSYDNLRYNRNCPSPILPEATPIHVLAPRTGKIAVENITVAGDEKVLMDEASIKKIEIANDESLKALSNSFLSDANQEGYSFPKNLEFDENEHCEFPFKKNSRYLGLIHADGNGLGQTLMDIQKKSKSGEEYTVLLRLFSDRLEKSTIQAAQKATDKLIEKYKEELEAQKKENKESDGNKIMLPMRPLVLGGDDLTVLVRADYAMQFTEDYCKAFEEATEEFFKDLCETSKDIIPEKLTACAGVAYVKNNQPFIDAFELAESLCSASKKISKDVKEKEKENRNCIPASVTSQVVTNSFIEGYEDYKKKELTIKKGGKDYIATLGAYAFDKKEKSIPTLAWLRNLCEILKKNEKDGEEGVTPATIRQYATMIFGDENISREKWRRLIELLSKKDNKLDLLKECMTSFGNNFVVDNVEKSPWLKENSTENYVTPIFDAIQLIEMEGR